MTSNRQIEANRHNAQLSTGPITKEGKERSRKNAVRHGLTAETVISALEDACDYTAFELAVASGYDVCTAVERELVLRLASVLWRLRRATAIESGLFEIQAWHLLQFRQRPQAYSGLNVDEVAIAIDEGTSRLKNIKSQLTKNSSMVSNTKNQLSDLTQSFVRLSNLPSFPLDRLGRYEAALWRQACQLILLLRGKAQRA